MNLRHPFRVGQQARGERVELAQRLLRVGRDGEKVRELLDERRRHSYLAQAAFGAYLLVRRAREPECVADAPVQRAYPRARDVHAQDGERVGEGEQESGRVRRAYRQQGVVEGGFGVGGNVHRQMRAVALVDVAQGVGEAVDDEGARVLHLAVGELPRELGEVGAQGVPVGNALGVAAQVEEHHGVRVHRRRAVRRRRARTRRRTARADAPPERHAPRRGVDARLARLGDGNRIRALDVQPGDGQQPAGERERAEPVGHAHAEPPAVLIGRARRLDADDRIAGFVVFIQDAPRQRGAIGVHLAQGFLPERVRRVRGGFHFTHAPSPSKLVASVVRNNMITYEKIAVCGFLTRDWFLREMRE